jgi:hypothetical protein
MRTIFTLLGLVLALNVAAQSSYQVAVIKYKGGGDYYSNPTSMPNMVQYCNTNLNMNINDEVPFVEVGSIEIFDYPLVHLTGHGNVLFSMNDADNLRDYLTGGGFLHIDDNYGLDQFIRPQMKKVFPDLDFIEISFDHPIYHQAYDFNQGLPKVHEHDGNPPQGFGLFYEGRMVCFYSYEADLGDGWEDAEVHNDSDETRLKALRMGANIFQFALMGDDR